MKRLIIGLIILLLLPIPAISGVKGSMTGIGVGARGVILHGSFAAIADDYSANFWNPAGMAFINRFSFGAMLFRLPLNLDVSYIGVMYPVSDVDRIGLSWSGCYIGNLQARSGNSADPDYLFSSSDQAIGLSYSRRIGQFGIGFSGKALYHSLDSNIGIGYSFDIGALYRINNSIAMGLAFYDVSSKLHWQTGANDRVEKIVNFAGSYRWQNLTMAFGIESDYMDKRPEVRLSGGTELRAMDLLVIRGGIYNNKVGFGFGLSLGYQNIDILVNYAAISSHISDQLCHGCDVSLSWNKSDIRGNNIHQKDDARIVSTQVATPAKPDTTATISKQEFLPGEIRVVQIIGDKVNVRKGPGLIYVVIGVASRNQIFPLLSEYMGWYQINFSGAVGWIEGSFVIVR